MAPQQTYKAYVGDLLRYLLDFYKRSQPLMVRAVVCSNASPTGGANGSTSAWYCRSDSGFVEGSRCFHSFGGPRRGLSPQVLSDSIDEWRARFSSTWSKGAVPFWSELAAAGKSSAAAAAAVASGRFDLTAYSTVGQLEALGLEALKVALTSLGLKCGYGRASHCLFGVQSG